MAHRRIVGIGYRELSAHIVGRQRCSGRGGVGHLVFPLAEGETKLKDQATGTRMRFARKDLRFANER
jgi:hypothetical protein